MTDAELIARLRKDDEYEPLGHDGWEAADRIEQLAVTNEALTEQLADARAFSKKLVTAVTNPSGQKCVSCRAAGSYHCSDPINCGGMIDITVDEAIASVATLTAAAERSETLGKACTEWAEVSQSNYQRAKAAEAKLAKAVEVIEWALISWDDHNKHGYNMQGDWVFDARSTLAEIKGEIHE
jgi:hypothetical protein